MQLGGPRKGYRRRNAPAFPIAATGDWRAVLKAAGYRVSRAHDDNPEHINHCIYDHEDHLYVGIWDPCSCLSEFFVARPEANVFYATWYVDFWRSCAAINQAQQIERAVDAFIAFIRYGHGEQTVDKYGFPG